MQTNNGNQKIFFLMIYVHFTLLFFVVTDRFNQFYQFIRDS